MPARRDGGIRLTSALVVCFATVVVASSASAVDEHVIFRNAKAGIDLGGTITRPDSHRPLASIILITGSGAQDRDETIFGHKPFKTLAEHLTARGFLVLRYDDRGVGQSGGSLDGTTTDFADDAEAALDFLTRRGEGPIGYIGHSEGGTIGALVAARRAEVKFVIMLAGPALRGDRLLREQIMAQQKIAGAVDSHLARNDRNVERLIAAALTSGDALEVETEALRNELGESRAWASSHVAFFGSRWMRHFLAFDPAPALAAMSIPMLVLYGEKDRQVVAETNRVAAAAALSGNPAARVHVVSGVNHLFQTAATGLPVEYASIVEDMSPAVLNIIADWLLARRE